MSEVNPHKIRKVENRKVGTHMAASYVPPVSCVPAQLQQKGWTAEHSLQRLSLYRQLCNLLKVRTVSVNVLVYWHARQGEADFSYLLHDFLSMNLTLNFTHSLYCNCHESSGWGPWGAGDRQIDSSTSIINGKQRVAAHYYSTYFLNFRHKKSKR